MSTCIVWLCARNLWAKVIDFSKGALDTKQALLKASDMAAGLAVMEKAILDGAMCTWKMGDASVTDVISILTDNETSSAFTEEQQGVVSTVVDAKSSLIQHTPSLDDMSTALQSFLKEQWKGDQASVDFVFPEGQDWCKVFIGSANAGKKLRTSCDSKFSWW